MSNEVVVTTENFESEVKNSTVPVLLDFWADWCMPCKMIAPILEEMSESYSGKLKIGKVDVDAQGDLAMEYNVISIPTLVLVKNGEVVEQRVGAAPKATIEEMVKPHVE